jgi:hypothetical protein
VDERIREERRIYPWNEYFVRYDSRKKGGCVFGDFPRQFHAVGRGDYMGVAAASTTMRTLTSPCSATGPTITVFITGRQRQRVGNDVYRPLSPEDKDDFRPYRGNCVQDQGLNSDGAGAGQVRPGDL